MTVSEYILKCHSLNKYPFEGQRQVLLIPISSTFKEHILAVCWLRKYTLLLFVHFVMLFYFHKYLIHLINGFIFRINYSRSKQKVKQKNKYAIKFSFTKQYSCKMLNVFSTTKQRKNNKAKPFNPVKRKHITSQCEFNIHHHK